MEMIPFVKRKKIRKDYAKHNREKLKKLREQIIGNKDKLWCPPVNVQYDEIVTNSCYQISKHMDDNIDYSNVEFESGGNPKPKKKYLKSIKVNMEPKKKQQWLLQRWFRAYILMYNETIKYIKSTINFTDLRKIREIDKLNINNLITLKTHQKERVKLINKRDKLILNINTSNTKKKNKRTKTIYTKRINQIRELRNDIIKFNILIDSLEKCITKQRNIRTKLYNKIYENINCRNVRTYKIKSIRDEIIKNSGLEAFEYDISIKAHILDCSIKLACASYKSCFTNYLEGNTNKFRVKYWKLNRTNKIMEIESSFIKNNQICEKEFGKMSYIYDGEPYQFTKKNAVTIHYDGDTGRYTLLVPQKIELEETKKTDYIGLDPGIRTFMTGLSKNEIIKMATNLNEIIRKYLLRIDKINNNENMDKEIKKIKVRKYNRKITNKVDEVHWKIIKYLTDNYGTIIIGDFSIKDASKKDKSNINKMTKRIGYRMSHYKFRQRLAYKCETKGINLKIVDESYTSKMCSVCGNYKKDLTGEKIYKCKKCGVILDRDINGCRCIIIKIII